MTTTLDSNSWGPNRYDNGSGSTTTNLPGHYEIIGFTEDVHGGSANLMVRPPASSGFTTAALSNLRLAGDVTQRIILQRPDLSPAQIVAGPVVVHLSDTSVSVSWTTNEAANSRVNYGVGSLDAAATDGEFTTNHTITLLRVDAASYSLLFRYEIACAQLCGLGRYRMRGFVTVLSAGEFQKWVEAEAVKRKERGATDAIWR